MFKKAELNKIAFGFHWRKPVAIIARLFWQERAKKIARHLLPYLSEGESVIDIGAGSGMVSLILSRKMKADFTLVDVIDWNITKFPLILLNGYRIPEPDKKFDTALLIDVLHHSEEEEQLLDEALRVAKRVIITEEIHKYKIVNLFANITDNLQYLLYGMPLGIHHRNKQQWIDFLQKHASRVECIKEYWNHAVFLVTS